MAALPQSKSLSMGNLPRLKASLAGREFIWKTCAYPHPYSFAWWSIEFNKMLAVVSFCRTALDRKALASLKIRPLATKIHHLWGGQPL